MAKRCFKVKRLAAPYVMLIILQWICEAKSIFTVFWWGFLQHPQIQKKSQYIKYLCCDDVRTLHQWVNGIRIAKVRLNPSVCSGLSLTLWKEIVCINLYVLFLCFFTVCVCVCVVWETAICELPGGHEEDRGGVRLVLSLYLQHPLGLQFCQHTW